MIVRAALAIILLGTTVAAADDRCAVPLADWQPRSALQQKLEGEGWIVLRIRTDDGCYKVLARDLAGRTLEARFDPATLELVPTGHGRYRHRHRGGDHEDERD